MVEAVYRLYQFWGVEARNNYSPTFVIAFDESLSLTDSLREGMLDDDGVSLYVELRRAIRLIEIPSFWALFVAPAGKFHLFSPAPQYEASTRVTKRLMQTFPPITEVEMDGWAERVPCDGSWTLARVASTYNMAHLGRALYVCMCLSTLPSDLVALLPDSPPATITEATRFKQPS